MSKKQLFNDQQRRLLIDRGYTTTQAREIVSAATPRLALVVDDWVTALLKSHTPGILGLILSVTLYTVAVHKQRVRRALMQLYGVTFPPEVTTVFAMEQALEGALRVLISRQDRGEFKQKSWSGLEDRSYTHLAPSHKVTVDSKATLNYCSRLPQELPPGEEEEP